MSDQEELIRRLAANRPAAHALFFRSRHQNEDAPFHHAMDADERKRYDAIASG